MHAVSESQHRLVVTHDSVRLTRWLGGSGCALLGLAVWRFHQAAGTSEQFWGAVGAGVMFLLVALVVFERSRFVIDAAAGMVEWQRRRVYGARHGAFMFTEVKGVIAESPIGDDDSMRRIVFHTEQGELPITVSYLPDTSDVIYGLALKIRLMIGLTSEDQAVPADVHALADHGRTIEAIKTLRERRGGSLIDAHAAVKARERR